MTIADSEIFSGVQSSQTSALRKVQERVGAADYAIRELMRILADRAAFPDPFMQVE